MFSLLLIVMAYMMQPTHQSTNTPPPPELILNAIDAQVDELEDRRKQLGPAPLLTCSDEDPARAVIQSMTPSGTCGLKCVRLDTCPGGSNTTEFCMYYIPGQGTFNYASVQQYTLTIACTDDVEKPTTMPFTLRIATNSPPVFDPPTPLVDTKTISGTTLKPGDIIYTVKTIDIDGDPVYCTMTTDPTTPYLSIGYATGEITCNTDGRFICIDKIRALVTCTDKHNPPIGPYRIDFTLKPANTAPYISNLDAIVNINEKVGVGFTAYTINVVDDVEFAGLNMNMRATSDAGMEQYLLDFKGKVGTVKTRIDPNYERPDTRNTKLCFDVNDGFCKGNKTLCLTINIVNVNEPPTFYPSNIQNLEVYEGDINIPTGLQILDEDIK